MDPFVDKAIRAIDAAVDNKSNFNPEGYDVIGLSSNKVRHLLNNLCDAGTVYADVGCYMGSTLFAALMGNESVKAYAIDDYQSGIVYPKQRNMHDRFHVENPVDEMVKNAEKWMNIDCSVGFSVRPLIEVQFNKEERPNVIFYDADNEDSMSDNLDHLHEQADNSYILVVDDANFNGVVEKTQKFLEDKNVVFERLIRTEISEDENDWWNGVMIAVIEK